METKLQIEGTYLKAPKGYFSEFFPYRLVISQRKPKGSKPTEYILLKTENTTALLPDGTNEKYISGIFWESFSNGIATGRIDFQGIYYTIEKTDYKITIKIREGKSL